MSERAHNKEREPADLFTNQQREHAEYDDKAAKDGVRQMRRGDIELDNTSTHEQ